MNDLNLNSSVGNQIETQVFGLLVLLLVITIVVIIIPCNY